MPDINLLNAMLASMRMLRDAEPHGEIRSAYNAACDRLDVLVSKLHERHKKCQSTEERAAGFSPAQRLL